MKKIAVIGLGLIGASLLKALQGKGFELYGISRNPETVAKAKSQGLIVEGSCEYGLLTDMDLVFIATPIDCVLDAIDKVSSVAPSVIIADLASLKGFILDYVNGLDLSLDFIGLHPMAGTENQGFDSAVDGLFVGANWAVVPSDSAQSDSVKMVCDLIKSIDSVPVFTDASAHDKAVAMISHMPMILSQALFSTVDNDLAKKLAASGFRDMTRLACSNAQMAKDMMKYNHQNIKEVAKELKDTLGKFLMDYENQNLEGLSELRARMYDEQGKNIY